MGPVSFLSSHLESIPFISELPTWSVELLPSDLSLQNKALPTLHLSWDRKSQRHLPKQGMTGTDENTSQRVRGRQIWFPLFAAGFFHAETQQIETISNWDKNHMVSRITHCFYKVHGWNCLSLLVEVNQNFPTCYSGVFTWGLINSFVTCVDNL